MYAYLYTDTHVSYTFRQIFNSVVPCDFFQTSLLLFYSHFSFYIYRLPSKFHLSLFPYHIPSTIFLYLWIPQTLHQHWSYLINWTNEFVMSLAYIVTTKSLDLGPPMKHKMQIFATKIITKSEIVTYKQKTCRVRKNTKGWEKPTQSITQVKASKTPKILLKFFVFSFFSVLASN